MNQILNIVFIVLLVAGAIYFLTGSNVESISVDQLRSRFNSNKNIGLIDVRSSSEYYGKLGHIEGSILIPLGDLKENINKINSAQYDEIYTICLSGGRSAKAVNILNNNNIKAINVRGGMAAWNMLK